MDILSTVHKQLQHQGAMRILQSGGRSAKQHRAARAAQGSGYLHTAGIAGRSYPKVPGQSSLPGRNSVSPFGFTAVTIHAEAVFARYGDQKISGTNTAAKTAGYKSEKEFHEIDPEAIRAVQLPESFHDLKDTNVFYHGRMISEYELVQTAVAAGKMEIDPEARSGWPAAREAFSVMIREEAGRKYSWSDTLYSEDGQYTFTKNEDGSYRMHVTDDAGMGASLEEIAGWIMSGMPNRNIETRYLNYLRSADPDLYEAAQRIGSEVRTCTLMEDAYCAGVIGEKQHDYDISLLGILFGIGSIDDMRSLLHACRTSGNYLPLLEHYRPEGAAFLQNLRLEQSKRTNGGVL